MVIKIFLSGILLFLFSLQVGFAQNAGKIKENVAYIWAESVALEKHQASAMAIDTLLERLCGICELHQEKHISASLLRGYRKEVDALAGSFTAERRGRHTVLRYIHKDSLNNIFEGRKTKILQMIAMAEAAQDKLQMDVALRNYSWAEILLKSIPEPALLKYSSRKGESHLAQALVAARIDEILEGMEVRFKERADMKGNMVEVDFTYNGKPVRNIDYRFFDGKQWSRVYGAKDGKGVVEKPEGADVSCFKVKYESESPYMMHIDAQVKEIKELFEQNGPEIGESNSSQRTRARNISAVNPEEIKNKILSVLAKEESRGTAERELPEFEIAAVHDAEDYEKVVQQFCKGVASPGHFLPDSIFAQDGYSIYNRLIHYGNARLLDVPNLSFYRMGKEVYCRSIPMVFDYGGNERKFIEDIVLAFNEDKKIVNITFSLGKAAAGEIVAHENWPEEARIILITFLENYKTAYALKRLDYISSVFDDDALIITGRVLRNVKMGNELMENKYVTLTKHNKEQYISHLERVFASNEFINISFADNKVLMMGKDKKMFGIQIAQDYYSTNYSDKGYLFLMVDLKDYTSPVIHVRTWQTAPDKEFGIIGPHHF